MTTQQKAVIIGFYKQGAPIEQIIVIMGMDFSRIKLVIDTEIPKQFIKHVEDERTKSSSPKKYSTNYSIRPTKIIIHNGKDKRANKKSIPRPIQTHIGL